MSVVRCPIGHPVPVASRSLPDLIHGSADPTCRFCLGDGLVCEDHPDRSWDTGLESDCHCGSVGMPCACTGLEAHG